jgi:hypothetical protein
MSGHDDARRATGDYAADLEGAGLARHFPTTPELRHIAIEILAERSPISDVAADPRLIADAIVEAVEIRYLRRQG